MSKRLNTCCAKSAAITLYRRPKGFRTTAKLRISSELTRLTGLRLLVLVDDDNLRISMERQNRKLSYRALLARLKSIANEVHPFAVFTAPEGDSGRQRYFRGRGWNTLNIPQEKVRSWRGITKLTNADMDICFEAGRLMLNGFFDGVLVCSGDGDLGAAIARGIRRIQPHTKIFTLSVPGTGSRRLKERTDLFDGNMVVGNDLVRPAHNGTRLEPTY